MKEKVGKKYLRRKRKLLETKICGNSLNSEYLGSLSDEILQTLLKLDKIGAQKHELREN